MKPGLLPAVLIVGGAAALYSLGGLAPAWGANANLDASIWPLTMLALLAVLGIALVFQSARDPRPKGDAAPLDWRRLRNMLVLLSYVPALYVLGFYITAFTYAFALPSLLGGARLRDSAVFAVVFTSILYAVFTVGLNMELPRGLIMLETGRPSAGAIVPATPSAAESAHARAA